MNEYQKLLAYLKILYHNLTTLHRNLAKDDAWFANHKQIGKWYEEVSDEIDDLVEAGIALGIWNRASKKRSWPFRANAFPVQPRGPEESFRLILGYFRSVAGMMQAAEAIVPASVANKLQEYEYFWNKEANFKLASAIGEHAPNSSMEFDDD